MAWLIDRDWWEQRYSWIRGLLSLSFDRDQEAADELSRILGGMPNAIDAEALARLAGGAEEAVVVGCGPLDPEALGGLGRRLVVAADGASRILLEAGIVPRLVVTDLDGDLEYLLRASRLGAALVVHAHGDNVEALRRKVRLLEGPVIGSTQVEPRPHVYNFGGFTDGDRALFVLRWIGVRRALLLGFDFDRPRACPGSPPKDMRAKAVKLSIARKLLEDLEGMGMDVEIVGSGH
ncbi:MAG: 6-hydroxymethylpterin diphosphokinase MptE-like protein [Desulfurococcaceae archaeon]